MYIKHLELKDFRNYGSLSVDFGENVNLILGANAQGKTNLLEALYVSAAGRSFRTARDSEMISFGHDMARIRAEASKDCFDTTVEIVFNARGAAGGSKSVKKDGKNIRRASELLNNILVVIFSPEDLRLVKDEPEKRRRFIDRELCQISPAYYDDLMHYRKALIQRNAYIKGERVDREVLDIWDRQLAHYGAGVMTMRRSFIEKLSGISAGIHRGISGGAEELSIIYLPDAQGAGDRESQQQNLYSAIRRSYAGDMRLRTTTTGPHRDDISFFVNGIDMRSFGSQGQQRTSALSLKLAELGLIREETGEKAVLLLDDVMSELDQSRQEYLIDTMKESQMFITTTELEKGLAEKFGEAETYHVEAGHVRR